jgi:cytidylate kinase
MPIIFVCSVPFGGGERLARRLADKLGYAYLSREDVVARANEAGIPVGKLEVAMVRKPAVQERLARLKQRYLAVATATICERAVVDNVVYYGRAGHLLLPGVSHILRVRVIPEHDQRVETAMERTKLTREKAERFLQDIDADISSWVHFVHGADMDDLKRYDFVVNLENMSIENAATALCGIAELPDFRPTPASRRAMDERLLQARARITLALDERTADADFTVRSADGVVTITYAPRQAAYAPLVPAVLADLPGCREIRCTVASTNILWIQEAFDPASETFRQVSELARRWGAAIELVRYRASGDGETPAAAGQAPRQSRAEGGIEDDVDEQLSPADRSFRAALDALVGDGRSGGGRSISGDRDRLLAAVNPEVSYSLVVLGDVFLERPTAARTRMARELGNFIRTRVKTPLIPAAELSEKLHFGLGGFARLAIAAAAVAAIYALLFHYQVPLLDLLGGAVHQQNRWLAPVAVAIVAPLVAWLYGSVASLLLRLIRLE